MTPDVVIFDRSVVNPLFKEVDIHVRRNDWSIKGSSRCRGYPALDVDGDPERHIDAIGRCRRGPVLGRAPNRRPAHYAWAGEEFDDA